MREQDCGHFPHRLYIINADPETASLTHLQRLALSSTVDSCNSEHQIGRLLVAPRRLIALATLGQGPAAIVCGTGRNSSTDRKHTNRQCCVPGCTRKPFGKSFANSSPPQTFFNFFPTDPLLLYRPTTFPAYFFPGPLFSPAAA